MNIPEVHNFTHHDLTIEDFHTIFNYAGHPKTVGELVVPAQGWLNRWPEYHTLLVAVTVKVNVTLRRIGG